MLNLFVSSPGKGIQRRARSVPVRGAAGLLLSVSLGLAPLVLLLPRSAAGADAADAAAAGGATSSADSAASARSAARRLVLEGDSFYARQEYAQALERYQSAYQLMHVPTVGIEVMRAQKALGKLVEANATALEVAALPKEAREPAVFDQARLEAAQAGLRSSGMIPTLWLDVQPRGIAYQVLIDGTAPAGPAPFQLNPGAHDIRLSAHGYQVLELKVTLQEAERQTLTAVLFEEPAARAAAAPPTAAAPAPPQAAAPAAPSRAAQASSGSGRTLGWVGIGVAGAAAVVGTVAGISALKQKPDCPNNVCAPSQSDAIESSERMGVIANVSFGVAIVAGVFGIWQLLASDDPDAPASAALLEALPTPPLTLVGLGSGPLQLQWAGSF